MMFLLISGKGFALGMGNFLQVLDLSRMQDAALADDGAFLHGQCTLKSEATEVAVILIG